MKPRDSTAGSWRPGIEPYDKADVELASFADVRKRFLSSTEPTGFLRARFLRANYAGFTDERTMLEEPEATARVQRPDSVIDESPWRGASYLNSAGIRGTTRR